MKHLFTAGLCLLMNFSLFAGTRDALWKQVDDAVSKGLPKTAITNLEPIIQGALHDKAYAEAVKAIGKKIALEGNIQGNKPEEKITRLEAEIAKAPTEMTPVLDTLLAHWYWQYFQQNKWRFMQRTATAQSPGKDFTTWDLPRLFAEIDRQFQKALAADKLLKASPVADWNDLLEKGNMPDTYRPTLYDFIAHEALEFYTSGEQAAAKPEDAFELSADSPALDPAEKFLAWQPATTDTNAPALKAIRLYQDLLRFHRNDPAPRPAFADADLDRLTWAGNTAFGEKKNARYKAALEGFIRDFADDPLSAIALEREARLFQQESDLVTAHDLAARGAKLFPDSPGGRLCHNLVEQIETKSAFIGTERVWNAPWPKIDVRYRNVTNVYFRAIPANWDDFLQKNHNRPENLSNEERRAIVKTAPALDWSEALPATTNYQERVQHLPAPDKLKPGFYFIAASCDPQFGDTENMVSLADVWVSDLALITRTQNGRLEGWVLEANSGEPVPGAAVSAWHLDNQGKRVADPALNTDTNGFFSLKTTGNRDYLLRVRSEGRELASHGDLWVPGPYENPEPKPAGQTVFFTDRSIYRPGQTVSYKGICLWIDQKKDDYKVLKGEEVTVVFRDPNGKEIERQKKRANDFGSITGSFTAPRDRVTGPMTIQAEGRAQGATSVRVEEYKRPKFQVTLDAPKTAPRLNDKVALTGHAMNYTGAAVDSSPVKFRVTREVRMPWWWGWWGRGSFGSQSQEITHGTLQTGTDGTFTIEFVATPDPKVPEKNEPTFVYQVHADVTDTAGETRSDDRAIRVGYTALEATLSAADWQTVDQPVELKITTQTLDGEPQVAEGSVKIYALQAPATVQRSPEQSAPIWRYRGLESLSPDSDREDDLSNPNNWPLGKVIAERGFTTDTNGAATLSFKLPAGACRAVIETQDRFGKKVSGRLPLQVLNPDDSKLALKIPHLLAAKSWELQPGDEFLALWGTGYDTGRAFVEIEHRHQIVQRFWTTPGRTQQPIKLAITEAHRGGFVLHVTQVRENRAYFDDRFVAVPWKNKDLTLRWEHFTSKLLPGQKETWTLQIEAPNATSGKLEKEVAELVAALYDESLDAFAPHDWMRRFSIFRQDYSYPRNNQFANFETMFQHVYGSWERHFEDGSIAYRSFPSDLTANLWQYRLYRGLAGRGGITSMNALPMEAPAAMPGAVAVDRLMAAAPAKVEIVNGLTSRSLGVGQGGGGAGGAPPEPPAPKPNLDNVAPRKNLNETAFFFPQLVSDSNGVVRLTFTMPEALTRWHFLGFAHDRSLRSGFLDAHAVTAKDLMVQPNPPRFLREGDTIEFTVKISNQSDKPQTGSARLNFSDAASTQPADKLLGNQKPEQPFSIPAKESRTLSWRISVPDGCGFLTYKAVAAAAAVSDGEEGAIPVLSRRILVTESLPLPIRGPATKKFEFTRLLKSGSSKTLENQSLTVQMVSNPAWYAVLALPYLMEYPYECSEQVFNRLYANSLARSIANSDPKIHRIFELWRNTPALDTPLEKNQDLKNVALEETPWLRQAQAESQARRNVGILFDDNRLNNETERTLQKLTEMQLSDGSWPWFPGGPRSDYITLYIVTGFGRLRHLGVDISVDPILRNQTLQGLDSWMNDHYERIQESTKPDEYVPSATDALYLYGRSFFLKDMPVQPRFQKAVDFFLKQSRQFWLKTDSRQTQGHLALALNRWGGPDNTATAQAILRSLKERSVSNDEMGMFWRDTELSWWWFRAPIETQALMIEAFNEVAQDKQAVDDCQVWLLKQKQTQDWKTTKATADAVYALLLRGRNLLSSDALVQVKLDGIDLTPKSVGAGMATSPQTKSSGAGATKSPQNQSTPEPGTGFYEYRFVRGEIKPKLGDITVRKVDQGVAWGSVHWQYLEDMRKVTPYAGTPLRLKKTLYVKTTTSRGQVLQPVNGPIHVGDELVVRVELRTDRDMEYVHLKDQRGSGTEPVNVLSGYRYQDGLAYYESTRDTASHFFIDYLPKGTYVFEYSTRVQLKGDYQTGIAEIQCMYAPEFNSHSESFDLKVR